MNTYGVRFVCLGTNRYVLTGRTPKTVSYLILGARDGKVVRLRRSSVPEAFQTAAKLRLLGYTVKVQRPGTTTLEAEVERAVTA